MLIEKNIAKKEILSDWILILYFSVLLCYDLVMVMNFCWEYEYPSAEE